MLNSADEAVIDAKAAEVPPDATIPEVKPEQRDVVFGPSLPPKINEAENPKPKKPSRIGRALRFGFRTVLVVACLGGVAWAVETYYPVSDGMLAALTPHRIANVQSVAANDDTSATIKEMAEEIRSLKASVDTLNAAQGKGTANVADRNTLQTQLDTVQTTTSAALADLVSRVDKLEADSNAKLSQIGEQLDGIEHRIPAQRSAATTSAAPPRSATTAFAAQQQRKRVAHVHDAFDPSRDPTAPGAPRPLGSAVTANPVGPYYAR
jgi:TolA-binding protein